MEDKNKNKSNDAANTNKPPYVKPPERLDVQTVVTDLESNAKVYLDGIIADYQKIKFQTGFNRFKVQVMVAFKILGNDDKYKALKLEYFVIQ